LLSEPLDLMREFAFCVWLLSDQQRSVIVAKIHHAIVDAHSGRRIIASFAQICSRLAKGERLPTPAPLRQRVVPLRQRLRDAWAWLRTAKLSRRVPPLSLLADFQPSDSLERLPVEVLERTLPRTEYRRIRRHAAERKTTFAQYLCACLLRAMHHYNQDFDPGRVPDALGLMVAVSRRFRRKDRQGARGFEADTRLVTAPRALLERRDRSLEQLVKATLAPRKTHNELDLALLVALRTASRAIDRAASWLGRPAASGNAHVDEVHFTLSDLTVGSTRLGRPLQLSPERKVASLHYMVSPVAAAHGGLLVHLYDDKLHFTLLCHRGSVQACRLMDALIAELCNTND